MLNWEARSLNAKAHFVKNKTMAGAKFMNENYRPEANIFLYLHWVSKCWQNVMGYD